MRIALVNLNTNTVASVLQGDENLQYKAPEGYTAIFYTDEPIGPRWTFDGIKFYPPPNLYGFSPVDIPLEEP